jgi:hypothetical protein
MPHDQAHHDQAHHDQPHQPGAPFARATLSKSKCALSCRVPKRVIRLHDVVHRKAMNHESVTKAKSPLGKGRTLEVSTFAQTSTFPK